MIPVEVTSKDARLKSWVRVYMAHTLADALAEVERTYAERGWTLPAECYWIKGRGRVEVCVPVVDKCAII